MARPEPPDRGNLLAIRQQTRASRPLGVRPTNGPGTAGAGDIAQLGPVPVDFGRPDVQKLTNDEGHAWVQFRFTCPYMSQVKDGDLARMKALFLEIKITAVALSKGPYSLKQLAAMGHPYATAPGTEDRIRRLRKSGHNVPRFQPGKAIGHIRGITGSVRTLSVTNIQTGHFCDSWDASVSRDSAAVTGIVVNKAEYAAYLMEGTKSMIAHGAWDQLVTIYEPRLVGAWAEIVTVASIRDAKTRKKQVGLREVA